MYSAQNNIFSQITGSGTFFYTELKVSVMLNNFFTKHFMFSQYSLAAVVCALVVMSSAAPSGLAVPLAAPIVAPAAPVVAVPAPAPVVTAYSSQYVARNYNGVAVAPAVVPSAAYVAYPQVYAPAAPFAAGPLVPEYLI